MTRSLIVVACLLSVLPARAQPPGEVDDARLAGVVQTVQTQIDRDRLAGAVLAVWEQDRLVLHRALGQADVEAGRPMQRDALFRIASMTKPIVSATALSLVDDGTLSLDDPVADYLPAFAQLKVLTPGEGQTAADAQPSEQTMTVRHLLTHTAGLTYSFWAEEPHAQAIAEAGVPEGLSESDLTLEQAVERLAGVPLLSEPGEAWRYSLATDVLGRVIEVADARPLDVAVRDRILEPCGMTSTFFEIPEEHVDRLAALYKLDGDGQLARVPDGPQWEGRTVHSATYQLPGRTRYLSGGAGLVSTAGDYLRFCRMLLGRGELEGTRVLSKEQVRAMTRNQIGELECGFPIHGDKFGLGVGIHSDDSPQKNGASPGTYGWAGFFYSYFFVDPKRNVAGVFMAQLHPSGDQTLWRDFQQGTYDGLDAAVPVARADDDDDRTEQPVAFRRVTLTTGGNLEWRVTAPRSTADGANDFLPNPVLSFEVPSVEGLQRCVATLDRWGGHLGTVEKQLRFNANGWLTLPELETPPGGRAVHYYSQDSLAFEVPVEHLRAGANTVEGTCSTEPDHNWGQYGLYALRLDLFYDEAHTPGDLPQASLTRLAGETIALGDGSSLPEDPTLQVVVTNEAVTGEASVYDDIARVEVLPYSLGLDDDGDGRLQDWHDGFRQPRRGGPAFSTGRLAAMTEPPYVFTWSTRWLPDQPGEVRLRTRVHRTDGWIVQHDSPSLRLQRDDRSVRLIEPESIPEHFGVRVDETKTCRFRLPDDVDPAAIREARLSLRTWHGWDGHHDPLRFNDDMMPVAGANHHFDHDLLPIPAAALQRENTFTIHSPTHHHMLEVLWPGPLLLVDVAK